MDNPTHPPELVTDKSHFDPATYEADHIIKNWTAGKKVVFYRPANLSFMFPMVFVLIGAGILLWLLSASIIGELNTPTFISLFMIGTLSAGVGSYGCHNYLPSTLEFDWGKRTVTRSTFLGKKVIPFTQISEIVLRGKQHGGAFIWWYPQYFLRMEMGRKGVGISSKYSLILNSEYFDKLDLALKTWAPILSSLARTLSVPGQMIDHNGRVIHEV